MHIYVYAQTHTHISVFLFSIRMTEQAVFRGQQGITGDTEN